MRSTLAALVATVGIASVVLVVLGVVVSKMVVVSGTRSVVVINIAASID